jgi:hypothetical protein
MKAGPLGAGAGAAIGAGKAIGGMAKGVAKPQNLGPKQVGAGAGKSIGGLGKTQTLPYNKTTGAGKVQNAPFKSGTTANVVPLNASKMKKNTGMMEAI